MKIQPEHIRRAHADKFAQIQILKLKVLGVIILLAVLAHCTGCASYTNPSTRRAEAAWQVLAAYDTAQTVTIARSPTCLREADKFASFIYGTDHPSPQRVLATNALLAWAHWEAGAWIDRLTEHAIASEDPNRGLLFIARGTYYTTSFLGTGLAVGNNVSLGIKPFSKMECGR